LAVPPRVRFLERKKKADSVKATHSKNKDVDDSDDEDSADNQPSKMSQEPAQVQAQESYHFKASKKISALPLYAQLLHFILDLSDSDDDVLTLKRKDHALESGGEDEDDDDIVSREDKIGKKSVTKAALAKKILKKKIVANKKTVFNEEGEVSCCWWKVAMSQFKLLYFLGCSRRN